MPIFRRAKLLHCFSLLLLIAGLWPFNFWESNKAGIDAVNGLHLSPPSSVYTSAPAEKLLDLRKFTILLHLSSDCYGSNGYLRILSYSLDDEGINFMIGQWEDSLVFKLRASGKPEPIHFETEGILQKGERGRVAIVFNGEKLVLYRDGHIKNEKKTGPLSFSNWDGSFPLLIGSEANGKFPWKGNIYSIMIFDRPFLPEEVQSFPLSVTSGHISEKPIIDYSFNGGGSQIKDHGIGQPAHLFIPERFTPYKRQLLALPGIQDIRRNIGDILINVLAFIPLGFLLAGHFHRRDLALKNALLFSIIIGFLISLTIEVLQAFLPSRNSSMTDLIMNTIGTAIGGIISRTSEYRVGGIHRQYGLKRAARVWIRGKG